MYDFSEATIKLSHPDKGICPFIEGKFEIKSPTVKEICVDIAADGRNMTSLDKKEAYIEFRLLESSETNKWLKEFQDYLHRNRKQSSLINETEVEIKVINENKIYNLIASKIDNKDNGNTSIWAIYGTLNSSYIE
ncbi:hypothetical protein Ga0466249_004821 [Sporomusaceae bacterium BoRhaA]|uniref:hypothetical protein n=1 Tax=Pelorhabdus rhamnosifermentans TaxID=2772457 RepID=UPI001C060CB6|nr:hypothetical protein [Pelorhabdus rhamnosifermentans]MBU2703673.1 hypothetical protein [Pelorhabdus rhamnosifermentans]